MRLRLGNKHHLKKSADRKAQIICRFSRVVFIPRAQSHAQSLFLFPIVFGINYVISPCQVSVRESVRNWKRVLCLLSRKTTRRSKRRSGQPTSIWKEMERKHLPKRYFRSFPSVFLPDISLSSPIFLQLFVSNRDYLYCFPRVFSPNTQLAHVYVLSQILESSPIVSHTKAYDASNHQMFHPNCVRLLPW